MEDKVRNLAQYLNPASQSLTFAMGHYNESQRPSSKITLFICKFKAHIYSYVFSLFDLIFMPAQGSKSVIIPFYR